ncbi:MAG: glycosyltransferase family 2 protein [Burkholderiales bacterium]|nr:glycosyltransferase family 2 protein [Phycisphaerae bacterium]
MQLFTGTDGIGEHHIMKLIVTIPALNEEKTIAEVIRAIPRDIVGISEVEVLVCNDGSTDRTAELAEAAGATVITIHGRPGLGTVFRTGFERAMRRGADIIVNIDGDGQFNPADITALIQPILEDQADFVTCSRFKDPALHPTMPAVKFWGNKVVTNLINWVCGGTKFSDVSCGFRAFNRDAAYRMTLFGRYTYTQECFIDLFSKGVRIAEVPLKVRGVREHGKSRVASSILKYATNSLPIIIRAMRDIQPLKFFGGIAGILFLCGLLMSGFITGWWIFNTEPVRNTTGDIIRVVHKTSPFTSLITVSGVLFVLSFLMGALALLADMMGRHRKISEEMLYLARRRIYSSKRTIKVSLPDENHHAGLPTLPDAWAPIIRSIRSPDAHDHRDTEVHVTPERPAQKAAV